MDLNDVKIIEIHDPFDHPITIKEPDGLSMSFGWSRIYKYDMVRILAPLCGKESKALNLMQIG